MTIFPNNNANMVACAILVDCSGSMTLEIAPGFSRMDALEAGLEVLSREMKMDPTVRNSVEVSLIDFGGQKPHEASIIQDWVYARDFVAPKFTTGGSTPLSKALLLALEQVRQKKSAYRHEGRSYCRPWIITISDGQGTDSDPEWAQAVQATKNAIAGKEALILSVGIDGCPLDQLDQVSTYPARPLSSHRFSEFFVWLSASMGSTSSSSSSTSKEQFVSTDPWR